MNSYVLLLKKKYILKNHPDNLYDHLHDNTLDNHNEFWVMTNSIPIDDFRYTIRHLFKPIITNKNVPISIQSSALTSLKCSYA